MKSGFSDSCTSDVVLPFTDRDITDVSNLQAYVGGELAARAALNITDDQLAVLSSIHDELVAAYDADDARAVRLNHEFHRAINVAAHSPKLAQLMSQITRYAPDEMEEYVHVAKVVNGMRATPAR